jgi:hypothetical protein
VLNGALGLLGSTELLRNGRQVQKVLIGSAFRLSWGTGGLGLVIGETLNRLTNGAGRLHGSSGTHWGCRGLDLGELNDERRHFIGRKCYLKFLLIFFIHFKVLIPFNSFWACGFKKIKFLNF